VGERVLPPSNPGYDDVFLNSTRRNYGVWKVVARDQPTQPSLKGGRETPKIQSSSKLGHSQKESAQGTFGACRMQ
jgi:hypothetical protein